MDKEFLDLIEEYKSNKDLIDKLRFYILNHIYTAEDITDYIDLFSKAALEADDKVGYALSKGMYFWAYYEHDIELAHKYNLESLKLYHQIEGYSNKIGYLSILNNEFIYNNYSGILHKSYKIMSEAMQIAEENKNINYYFVYSINGIYLLLDLDLYDKAFEILKKLETNNVYLSDSDKAIMKILTAKINWELKNKALCLEAVNDLKAYNSSKHVLDDYIVNAYMIEVLLVNENIAEAKKYVDELLALIKLDISDSLDLVEAYLALARYYKAVGNSEEAFKYYKLIYPHYNNLLGTKLNALNECLDVFKLYDKKLYYEALEAKEILLDEINQTLVIVTKQDRKIYDEFSDFRYKFLFQKMEQLTEFISDINNLENNNRIDELIRKRISEILGASFVDLVVAKDDYDYKGLDLSELKDLKIYSLSELTPALKDKCDSLACIKMNDINLDVYLYLFIGLPTMGNLEKKENSYMISLIKEVLTSVLIQLERYNKAASNYIHDQLTQVYNRYGLDKIIQEQFKQANMLYLLMIDIDNFKHINDSCGHDVGDDILVKVASVLSDCLGNKNVARIGGEEFIGLVALSDNAISLKLDELLAKIRKIKIRNEAVTVSVGASKLLAPSNFKDAKLEADKKLYIAKNEGKDKYIL